MKTQDTPRLLALLVEAGVRFVVIGGVAAIAHGGATFTRDLDVLVTFDHETLSRLLGAIGDLDPRAALDPAHRPLPKDPSAFPPRANDHLMIMETPMGTRRIARAASPSRASPSAP